MSDKRMLHRSTTKHFAQKLNASQNLNSYFNVSSIDFVIISPLLHHCFYIEILHVCMYIYLVN
jgi:D-hexose-6-phosphate mutarotase